MTLFRPQRAELAEAMEQVCEVSSLSDLADHLYRQLEPFGESVKPEDITIKPYSYDARIGWDTHVVMVRGSVMGFTNGPLA